MGLNLLHAILTCFVKMEVYIFYYPSMQRFLFDYNNIVTCIPKHDERIFICVNLSTTNSNNKRILLKGM